MTIVIGTCEPTRFWSKVDRDGPVPEYAPGLGQCWIWKHAKTTAGYGTYWPTREGSRMAHRYAYELLVGPIPPGLQLDHLCRVRACVNPAHLEPVTVRENLLRSPLGAGEKARRTHCPQGHEYTPENTARSPRNQRKCRTCVRARALAGCRRRREAKRVARDNRGM